MVLSNTDIKKFIQQEKIKIEPHLESKIYPASYLFTLGTNLLKPFGNDLVDFKKGLLPEYEEIRLDQDGYMLTPAELVLGQTHEKISLCEEVAMIIEGRSELARVGIEVTQTSTFIEPNHKDSIITLEIKNNGKAPFMLYPRMKFAKGVFLKLKTAAEMQGNQGTYITQDEVSPPLAKDFFDYTDDEE